MFHRPPARARLAPRLAAALAALALSLGFAPGAQAGDEAQGAVVVELFTSQGCSSCPPADELLAELAARPDVIALSLHVDYWDYLGWADAFAMPGFTRRQAAYGAAAGARSVYTPQMIVDGGARVVGSQRAKVIAAIEAAARAPRAARISLSRMDERLEVRIIPLKSPAPAGLLWFVTYHTPAPVEIKRGENAGREIVYHNVARSWMKLGKWDGRSEAAYSAPAPAEDTGVAVILQEGKVGPVIAAARLEQ